MSWWDDTHKLWPDASERDPSHSYSVQNQRAVHIRVERGPWSVNPIQGWPRLTSRHSGENIRRNEWTLQSTTWATEQNVSQKSVIFPENFQIIHHMIDKHLHFWILNHLLSKFCSYSNCSGSKLTDTKHNVQCYFNFYYNLLNIFNLYLFIL